MIRKQIYFDHTCGDGCGCAPKSNLNTMEQNLVGKQGGVGPQGEPGPSGKNNVLNGSVTSGTDDSNGTDEAIGGSTIADLTAAGFNPTTKPTFRATIDATDTVNTKYWGRSSNAWLNWVVAYILPKLLPTVSVGDNDSILQVIAGVWQKSTTPIEKYNTTSTTSTSISAALAGTNVAFAVDSGLSYRKGAQLWVVDYSGDVLAPANYLMATVVSYSGTTLTVNVQFPFGTGTPNKWLIGLGSSFPLPFFDAATNNGKFFKTDAGNIVLSDPSAFTGQSMPWWNSTPPTGWLICNGTTQDQATYPELYEILRPSGAATSYAYTPGGSPLGPTQFRLPGGEGYIFGMVDSTDTNFNAPGKRKGVASELITGKYLPETSPWTITDPGHVHSMAPFGSYGAGVGGTAVPFNGAGATSLATTGITLAANSDPNFGTALSKYQPTEAVYMIIKAA
jgi:hypothetical protein